MAQIRSIEGGGLGWPGRSLAHPVVAFQARADDAVASRFGDIQLTRIAIPTAFVHTCQFEAGDGSFALILVVKGAVHLRRDRLSLELAQRQWTLGGKTAQITAIEAAEVLIVTFGSELAFHRDSCLRMHGFERYGDVPDAGRIAALHLMALEALDIAEMSTSTCRELAAITAHLVRLAVMERVAATPQASMRDTLRMRIRAYVERNLHDPMLSIESIAERFGCSKRNLHKVFRDDATTLGKFLWSARLERCRLELLDPDLRHRTITQIAFSWGFNNSAHFSRAFRNQYGVSPRVMRDQMLATGCPAH